MDHEHIRNAAYRKWESEGRPEGQHDRHWHEAEREAGGNGDTPTSTGSVTQEQVQEPSNDWPAAGADMQDPAEAVPAPVDVFDPPQGDGRRTFQNGDTDRKGQE